MSEPVKITIDPQFMTQEQLERFNRFLESIPGAVASIRMMSDAPPFGVVIDGDGQVSQYRLGMFKHTYREFLEAME